MLLYRNRFYIASSYLLISLQNVTVQPCPFINCRFVQSDNLFRQLPTTYFMLGVRPIKMNIQIALCEQAPNSILYIQFCMAELLPNK